MSHVVPLAPGQVFARDYRVIEPLAQGGMGAVYVVEQLSTSERRALKTLLPQFVADVRARQRFDQEARVAAQIASAHVVKVVQAGVDEATGMPWLCMELLSGETLADAIARSGSIAPATLATLFEQIGHALELAHRIPLVHRDLKPENIFLAAPQGPGVPFTAKVLDFGIAKFTQDQRATQAVGSPLWMAPEQLGNAPVTPATDVWALGLIAYYALSGKYYWRAACESGPVMSVIVEVAQGPDAPASRRAAETGARPLPPGFDAWFAGCTAVDPGARFPHAGAARDALVPLLRAAEAANTGTPSYPTGWNAAPPAAGYLATTPASAFPFTPQPNSQAFSQHPVMVPQPTPQGGSSAGIVAATVAALLGALGVVAAGAYFYTQRPGPHRARRLTPGGTYAAPESQGDGCETRHECADPLHQICGFMMEFPRCVPSAVGARMRISYDGLDPRWVGPARYADFQYRHSGSNLNILLLGFADSAPAGMGMVDVIFPATVEQRVYPVATHPVQDGVFVSLQENRSVPLRYQGTYMSTGGEVALTDVAYRPGGHVDGHLTVRLHPINGGSTQAEVSADFHADLPQ